MNMKLLLIAVFIFSAVAGFYVLRTASTAGLHSTPDEIVSSGSAVEASGNLLDQSGDAGFDVPSVNQTAQEQAEPTEDGKAILQTRCQACHMASSLEAMKKTRAEWEKALTKMAGFGVELSYSEKSILLDYLSVSD